MECNRHRAVYKSPPVAYGVGFKWNSLGFEDKALSVIEIHAE